MFGVVGAANSRAQVFHLFLWRVLENVITLEQKIFAYFYVKICIYICTVPELALSGVVT